MHDLEHRRRLGAWYTPHDLVEQLVAAALDGAEPVRVVDPACGDGRFLAAVRTAMAARGRRVQLCGVDVDPEALAMARERLGPDAELIGADALAYDWGDRRFDLVIGNPPFLSPLLSGRVAHRRYGAPYTDAAVEFWRLAHDRAEPDGGRVAFVLPVSVLANRDAASTRVTIAQRAAWRWWWWAETSIFPDAQVITGALVTELGGPVTEVQRMTGAGFEPAPSVSPPSAPTDTWGWLLADDLGLPPYPVNDLGIDGSLGQRALARGAFRDQFYGLIGAVVDGGSGPPLITSGLIDPGRCLWGRRRATFAGQRFDAPTVEVARLSPDVHAWTQRRLVPKVLVASQTRIIEAVGDPQGRWLPAVPVISVQPHQGIDIKQIAAVLTSQVASLWLAHRSAGSGRSARVVRVSAPVLNDVPWPAGDLRSAVRALLTGRVEDCAEAVLKAYGVTGSDAETLMTWWSSASPRRAG